MPWPSRCRDWPLSFSWKFVVFPTMDRNRWRVGAVDRVRPALNVRVAAAAVVREVILLLTRRQRGFPSRRQPGRPSFDVLDPISMTFRIVMMISWIGCRKFRYIERIYLIPFGAHVIVNCFCRSFVSSISFIMHWRSYNVIAPFSTFHHRGYSVEQHHETCYRPEESGIVHWLHRHI